ncbi:MAG: RecQ family ATP-dependent DNA helicase [Aestuariivita sp.]|nr:RecQ family ATP-dependent DNA helicase [Aestuariivita sp.]MCY4201044.1 RecQ family ATP-dependent DNA helicase [Aestuariivita sp.]
MTVQWWNDGKKTRQCLAQHRFPNLLSLDLEGSNHIRAIGAIHTGKSTVYTWKGNKKSLPSALADLDDFAKDAEFLVGHNIIEHDLKLLLQQAPNLKLLDLPAIDTLYLSPLAFPENPYHHLVKQYKEPGLASVQINDPLLDSELTLELLADVFEKLKRKEPNVLRVWHALLGLGVKGHAFDRLFKVLRGVDPTPLIDEVVPLISDTLSRSGCPRQAARIAHDARSHSLALTYLLAWLPVAGGNSIIPPYIEYRFQASILASKLRSTHCGDDQCQWCSKRLDSRAALSRWFGYSDFRAQPQNKDGKSLQRAIVEKHLAQENVLGILPTGTGKSLCYQLPALIRYEAAGALTVVISPLVALMADQVESMQRNNIMCASTINGLIPMAERADALARIRHGDTGIVLVAPEQLRNSTFRNALSGRRIGAWVIDEAHCLSKWGHDFRPDYRYVARYIAEHHGEGDKAPVLCLTATARQDVVRDICQHFENILQTPIAIVDGGAERRNLSFVVMPTTTSQRIEHIHQAVTDSLKKASSGGAIVYCTTRRSTEETAQALADRGLIADHFHAGLSPERKREVQRGFREGEVTVVVATNAFGMGIDKPDVRTVVHAEIPGSLESYLQEAGRAGRDGARAQCLLLFEPDDAEQQFSLTANSRLDRRDIQVVLRAIRRLDDRRRRHQRAAEDSVIATAGEILLEDADEEFTRDRMTDDDRVRTAIAWLEEAKLAQRDENHTTVFPSSLKTSSIAAACDRIKIEAKRREIQPKIESLMMRVVRTLAHSKPDIGVSTDVLMNECGCSMQELRKVFSTLEAIGVASNDMRITVYVHAGVENSSLRRLLLARELEESLIAELREEAPDQEIGVWTRLSLRPLAQRLREKEIVNPLPERLVRLLRSLSVDGRDEPNSRRSLELRARDMETIGICLRRDWHSISRIAKLRQDGAARILDHLLSQVPNGNRGVDLLVETTYGALEQAVRDNLALRSSLRNQATQPLVDRALLWMHEQEVLTLNRGLTVFRPAMSLKVNRDGRTFTVTDFKPLQQHYAEQTAQVHVVSEYAKLGINDINLALRLAADYFQLESEEFVKGWFSGKEKVIKRETLPENYETIVDRLNNPTQERIVGDTRERTSVLVLAGPGSGKTRVLVHRIAYLIKVRREKPASILALTYNRHAAVEARRRLNDLIGREAHGVNVMTCHALALRILGISFSATDKVLDQETFDAILRDAAKLLRNDDANALVSRDQMLGRLNWILVDEYQDIAEYEYELIAALAGKNRTEDDGRLNLFAVGDDDQNIYAWKGASVQFIRRFTKEYQAREEYLVENHRSTGCIIDAASRCIEAAADRLKRNHRLRIDVRRESDLQGGAWATRDPIAQGNVQILRLAGGQLSQGVAAISELQRLAALDPNWQWSRCAVIARRWADLDAVRSACLAAGIPAQSAREETSSLWRARETQQFLRAIESDNAKTIAMQTLKRHRDDASGNHWQDLLAQALDDLILDEGHAKVLPVTFVRNWLGEWSREARRTQQGLLLTSAHRAKGLEFDHVVILDGEWRAATATQDSDADRRLYYVAMTRARETLALFQLTDAGQPNSRDSELLAPMQQRAASLLHNLNNASSVLTRKIPSPDLSDSRLDTQVLDCTLKHVVLSFAGWRSDRSRCHRAISALSVGDPLVVSYADEQWKIFDRKGCQIGRMAKSWSLPSGMIVASAQVHGIFTRWSGDDSGITKLRSNTWEVVLPQLFLSRASRHETSKTHRG